MIDNEPTDVTPPPMPPRRDESEASDTPTEAGRRIGPYKLLQRLGQGGMGEVWLAEQSQPVRRQVAIKLIRPGMDSRHILARFEAERQALAMMDHPNIARVLDAGEVTFDGTAIVRPYFVMELVKGISITKYCDQEKLSLRERLQLFIPVCQAVQHAHQKGIIHRDLKPSNVLVGLYDGRPVPKVIDFGVVKAAGPRLTDQTLFTEVGAMIGTPEYMAPEQAELNNLDIDTRADVYSLGVMIYELITGSLPFTRKELAGAAFGEMLRIIREVEPPKPSTRLSNSDTLPSIAAVRKLEPKRLPGLVRGDLDWIVMKCLEKERGRRYASANNLASDIERYLSDEPVSAGPPRAGYRMRKFIHRNKGVVLAASLLMLTLVAGIFGTGWAYKQAIAERDQKEAERKRADTEKNAAVAVLDFLQNDLLKQASAWTQAESSGEGAAKSNPTVNDLLDRAAGELSLEKIDKKFPNQPLVQAQILTTIGSTYRAVGQYDKAIAHLRRAQDIETREKGAEHAALDGSMTSLARSYMDAGQVNEAIRLFQQIRTISTAKLGANHATTLAAMTNLAAAHIEIDQRNEAFELLSAVRDIQMATNGLNHRETLNTLHNIGSIHSQVGRDEESIRVFEQVRDARIALLGAAHPDTLATLFCLGTAYQNIGRVADAIKTLESIAPTLAERMGPDHPHTIRNLIALASAYSANDRNADAIPLLEKAISAATGKLGPDHRITLTAKQNLAQTYQTLGKLNEAIRLLEQVRDKQVATLGPDHTETIVTVYSLGLAYHETGRLPDAITTLENASNASSKKHGKNDHGTITAQQSLSIVYEDAGRIKDAVRVLEQVRDASVTSLGADHPQTMSRVTMLAGAYVKAGQFPEAESICRGLIKVFDDKKLDKWSTFFVRSLMGAALEGQKKYSEAEPFLLQGYQGIKDRREAILPKYRSGYVIDAVNRLINLYEHWNKPAEVAKWRDELKQMNAELKPTKP